MRHFNMNNNRQHRPVIHTPRFQNLYDAYVSTGHVTMISCDTVRDHIQGGKDRINVQDHDPEYRPERFNFIVTPAKTQLKIQRSMDTLCDIQKQDIFDLTYKIGIHIRHFFA